MFSHWGVATLKRPLSMDIYHQWLNKDYHGKMEYLKTHAPLKEDPQALSPQVKSAIVVAAPYLPHPHPMTTPLKQARVALYAQGGDYHYWLKAKLAELAEQLRQQHPEHEFLCFTDSSPILERDLAFRAGLGWIGKNTCLIHPKKGSLFLLGEIYTSLPITKEPSPLPDFCGKCTRCIEACPTQAITQAKELDARKCISYHTIESRELPPENLREKMGDWLFGCDICQTVCPWNQKIFKNQLEVLPKVNLNEDSQQSLIADLRYILTSSGKKIERDFRGTALARAGQFGLKRNALVVIANRQIRELSQEVETLLEHPKLGSLATWTLEKLKT